MLLQVNKFGLYCAAADVYIDPWRGVNKAIITHAHSDHARGGSNHYLCHTLTKPLLEIRLGKKYDYETKAYGETFFINGVQFSLHPAGHVIGSAQVRIEYKGEVVVVSGDYKTQNDLVTQAWEPVKCHHFVTESTFGLPIYNFAEVSLQKQELIDWVAYNDVQNINSVFIGYSIGKAQRIAAYLQPYFNDRLVMHKSVSNIHNALYAQGALAYPCLDAAEVIEKNKDKSKIIIVPPASSDAQWLTKMGAYKNATCSGWMQLRGLKRRGGIDKGFAISDHADWGQLIHAIKATEAENIYVTHGYKSILAKYIREEMQLNAVELDTLYEGETYLPQSQAE